MIKPHPKDIKPLFNTYKHDIKNLVLVQDMVDRLGGKNVEVNNHAYTPLTTWQAAEKEKAAVAAVEGNDREESEGEQEQRRNF